VSSDVELWYKMHASLRSLSAYKCAAFGPGYFRLSSPSLSVRRIKVTFAVMQMLSVAIRPVAFLVESIPIVVRRVNSLWPGILSKRTRRSIAKCAA